MFRVYIYQDQVLFIENASSPLGVPIGTLILANEADWKYFPSRGMGVNHDELLAISGQIAMLNTTRPHENAG